MAIDILCCAKSCAKRTSVPVDRYSTLWMRGLEPEASTSNEKSVCTVGQAPDVRQALGAGAKGSAGANAVADLAATEAVAAAGRAKPNVASPESTKDILTG
jgi:hypothetical protein